MRRSPVEFPRLLHLKRGLGPGPSDGSIEKGDGRQIAGLLCQPISSHVTHYHVALNLLTRKAYVSVINSIFRGVVC